MAALYPRRRLERKAAGCGARSRRGASDGVARSTSQKRRAIGCFPVGQGSSRATRNASCHASMRIFNFAGWTDLGGLSQNRSNPRKAHCWVALGYGGNGMTYAPTASDILVGALTGQPDADADLYDFG
jgi:hypothetical protein